jgi:hypothetical protein
MKRGSECRPRQEESLIAQKKQKNPQTMLTGVAGELQLQHAQKLEVQSQGR